MTAGWKWDRTAGVLGAWLIGAGQWWTLGVYLMRWQWGVKVSLPPGDMMMSVGLPLERWNRGWIHGPPRCLVWRIGWGPLSFRVEPVQLDASHDNR